MAGLALAEAAKTVTIDLLLQRQHVGAVVIDDKRGRIYFELSKPAWSPEDGYSFSISPTSNDTTIKNIYVAPMDGTAPAKLLFNQVTDDSYVFAGAAIGVQDVMSPDGRYLAIRHLKDGVERLGVYDLKRRRFEYIDAEAGEGARLSEPIWVGNNEIVASLNRGYGSDGLAWGAVKAARNLAAARESGWRDGAVTAEVVGGGRYQQKNDQKQPQSYVLINLFTRAMRLTNVHEEIVYKERLKQFRKISETTIYSRLEPSSAAQNPPKLGSLLLVSSVRGEVFLTNDAVVGSLLHYVPREQNAEPILLYHFNKLLAGVETAVGPIRIEHEDYTGEKVTSWLFLPPGASIDQPEPYPLMVIAYPGLIYETPPSNSSPFANDIWTARLVGPVQMEIFAAKGYAVLLPSIPYAKEGGAADPMPRIMIAIESALDSAIETRFVDADRMALTGHSFGGYATLAVAVQSKRFQVIIAAMAVSNIISQYGTFSPQGKINGKRFIQPGGAYDRPSVETRLFTLGAQPWEATERYIRNSPLFHVKNVTAPILLIHGDLDVAAHVTQAEEMFSALHREGMDVQFLKYLGEYHLIEQPQNQRDMWNRVFKFLSEM